MSWLSRVANVFRSHRVGDALDEELAFHVAATTDALIEEGVSPDEAAAHARRRLGNAAALRERSRDAKLVPWLDALVRDVRIGSRALRREALVSVAAIVSMALAIGACAAAFGLIDALILRRLPVADPDRLGYLAYANPEVPAQENTSFSYPLFQRFRNAAADRDAVALFSSQTRRSVDYADGSPTLDKPQVQFVSGNAFALLGLVPAAGRLLTTEDDKTQGGHPVAVISHGYWQARFGADPSAIGRWMTIDGRQFQIVGVTARTFTGVEPGIRTDVWLPALMYPQVRAFTEGQWHWFRIWTRLAPGTEAPAVRERFQAVFTQFRTELKNSFRPDESPDRIQRFVSAKLVVRPASNGPSSLRERYARPLWILAAVVALVLLIACTNVANLLTARAAARDREMALRMSIGAGRWRLMQQVLVESALLAALASVLGILFAALAAPAIVGWLSPADQPAYVEFRLDWRVLAFAGLLGLCATALFGLLPALRASSTAPVEALKAAGSRQTHRVRLAGPLVSGQVACSLAVLFVAGLLISSFHRLTSLDPGFVATGVTLVALEAKSLAQAEQGPAATLALERVRAMPGVTNASLSAWPLFAGGGWTMHVRVPGKPVDDVEVCFLEISPEFIATMGVPLLDGRDFDRRDLDAASPSVLVNRAFARRYFDSDSAAGRDFLIPRSGRELVTTHIVGVVGDAKYDDLKTTPPSVYVPMRGLNGTMQIRSALEPGALVGPLREVLRGVHPAITIAGVTQQSTLVDNTLLKERLLALLSGFFGLVSLALAAVGLYGVLNYSVVQRTREIGIRLALGARQRTVISQVLRSVAVHGLVGVAVGVAGGLYAARFLTTLLYDVEALDPVSLLVPVASLVAVGALAAFIPARRAASVDPMVALRDE
jgi:putative ABC transport system permease protein